MRGSGFVSLARMADRAAREQHREEQRRLREAALLEAERFVEEHERSLTALKELHLHCTNCDSWHCLAVSSAPDMPVPEMTNLREVEAQNRLASYQPGFWDKVLKRTHTKRQNLEIALQEARQLDHSENSRRTMMYKQALSNWKTQKDLACRLLAKDTYAIKQATANLFLDSIGFGVGLKMGFYESGEAVSIWNDSVPLAEFPSKKYTALKRGGVSERNMSRTDFYSLYQAHVCSGAIRIAREMFTLPPLKLVFMIVNTTRVNPATGRMESYPILSVVFNKEDMLNVRFSAVDPVELIRSCDHRMSFLKTKDPKEIVPLLPDDYFE